MDEKDEKGENPAGASGVKERGGKFHWRCAVPFHRRFNSQRGKQVKENGAAHDADGDERAKKL